MPHQSYSVNLSYKLSSEAEQAFLEVYFAGVRNEVCETFASRWGGLDQNAFERAFLNAQGDDKCVAIFALGLNATPEMVIRLLSLLSSSETPRLERWASALCLGWMKEQSAYSLIETLLLDGLSLDEYRREDLPSEEDLHDELRVFAIKRSELVMFLKDWASPTLLQTLRQAIKNAWEIEKEFYYSVIDYDVFEYVLGSHEAFGALIGLDFSPAYWKTAIVSMALGSFQAQPELTATYITWDLFSNPAWQPKIAEILARQFGLTKEEQDDYINNFSSYARTRSIKPPIEEDKKNNNEDSFEEDYEEEDEEDEEAYMVPIPQISLYSGHTARITTLSWSPDEKYVASGSEDGTIQVWESRTGKTSLIFNEHRGSIKVVAWSPQGDLVASGGNDRAVRVWNARTGEQVWKGIGHSAWICDLAWSPDGTRIASVALDKMVRVWDVSSKKLVHVLRGHEAVVTSVAWSPDGSRLVSGSGHPECLVYIWNTVTGEQKTVNRWHTQDEKKIRPHSSWLWNESIDEEYRKPSSVHFLSWSPNGKQIVSAGEHVVCHVWDAITGEEMMATYRTNGPVSWSSDSNTLFWLPNGAREVERWDILTPTQM